MRAFEFLMEDRNTIIPLTPRKAKAYIKKNCKRWVDASNGQLVYRGVRNIFEIMFIKKTRNDRKPLDTHQALSDAWNILINLESGSANRNNSIFVTGNKDEAREYGKLFVCIPVGNFHYTWSPEYYDWTRQFRYRQIHSLLKPDVLSVSDLELVTNPLHALDPKFKAIISNPDNYIEGALEEVITADRNLPEAIRMKHEIMVQCESAVYIEYSVYMNLFKPSKKVKPNDSLSTEQLYQELKNG